MTQQRKRQSDTKMVPVPSHSIVPERMWTSAPCWKPATWAWSSAA